MAESGLVTPIDGALIRDLPKRNVLIRDPHLRGFQVRVRWSERRGSTASYRVEVARGLVEPLGRVGVVKLPDAREAARHRLATVTLSPESAMPKPAAPTLRAFLTDTLGPWLEVHRKTAAATADRIEAVFSDLLDTRLTALTPLDVERWRTKRLKAGRRPTTVNRDLAALRSALSRAVDWSVLDRHPLSRVKACRAPDSGVVRYLSSEEERRLRKALVDRDDERRRGRGSANEWRRARSYVELPAVETYADHLTPLVLVALNTGLRFGELTALRWGQINWQQSMLSVRGDDAKNDKSRHVPLNREAASVLKQWLAQGAGDSEFVFPGPEGGRLVDVKTGWRGLMRAAAIAKFRFHDLRHTFASKLVMRGVDLNTVRELLGHADLKMTLRYAHLAPEHKAAAVATLLDG